MLPDGIDAIAEIIDDVVTAITVTGWEKAADDASDVATTAELLRLIYPLTLHTKAEATDFRNHNGIALGEFHLQGLLQIGDDSHYRRVVIAASHQRLTYHIFKGDIALAHRLGKVFSEGATALDVVPDKFDVYCHKIFCLIFNKVSLFLLTI